MSRTSTALSLAVLSLTACTSVDESLADNTDTLSDAITSVAEGNYVIKAVHSGKCVDVASAGTTNGTKIQQWTCNGSNAQVFHFKLVDAGIYEILNPNANKALDVRDVRTDNGAQLQLWQYGGGANQQFSLVDMGNGEYKIRARHSSKVLDVAGASTQDGAVIQQWTELTNINQRFRLVHQGGSSSGGVSPAGWNLVWSDEFNGPNGSDADGSKWSHAVGGSGNGNSELQYYTAGTKNTVLENGSLVITATPANASSYNCWYGICQYTSAKLLTQDAFDVTYGRVEARIQIPRGQGLWPAFWMLGSNIGSVGWPACGEIDVMENIGKEPGKLHGSLHGPGYSGGNAITGSYTLPGGATLADTYRTYAVEWDPGVVRFYLDNVLYETRTTSDLPAGKNWVYDHPFYLILNVAVGGTWPGSPNASTSFPQTMRVDYVRVYKRI